MPLLTEVERQQLLVDWNSTATEYPRDKCIHQLFEHQAEVNPDAIAIRHHGNQLTYGQLNQRANQLAHFLKSIGVSRETIVAIGVDRSPEMVIGLLAILKAGGTYLPLNTDYPPERLKLMLDDTESSVLLTTQPCIRLFPEYRKKLVLIDTIQSELDGLNFDNLANKSDASDLAYIMYTSGSTGQPKGTSIVHRGVVRLVQNTNYVSFNSQDVFLQMASLAFDASTFEIWGALLNGATLAIAPHGILSLADISTSIREYGVTTLWLTAGLFHQIVDYQLEGLAGVRQLLAGGDVLSPRHVRKTLTELPSCRVINGYGPTENTTFTCCFSMDRPEEVGQSVSIGRPIANTQVYVLDEELEPVPVGVTGELYVGGDGLARGYWRRPELTQEKFVAHPFSLEPGARLYRTGDRVRWLHNGTLEFLGRIDQQVKIRGFRVELGEVEATLQQHPGVLCAAVQPYEDVAGEKRLAAYFVPKNRRPLASSDLRDFLAAHLPHFMLPTTCVSVEALPLTENGKVDRRSLSHVNASPKIKELNEPTSPLESQLCNLWQALLGVESVGTHDSFFELGGNSLSAIRFVARLRDMFQVELAVADIYKLGNLSSIAQQVQSLLDSHGVAPMAPLTIAPRNGRLPLSSSQQRLWFLHQLDPHSQSYVIALAYRVRGELDGSLLERCLVSLIERHEVLRTTFRQAAGEADPQIAANAAFRLERRDLRGVPAADREGQLGQILDTAAREPMDLERGPLLRAWLVDVGPQEHAFLLVVHHLVFDGWSESVLFRELAQLYEAFGQGRPSPLAALPLQYADFAAWQQRGPESSRLAVARDYWKAQLQDAPSFLELPTDYPRPSQPTAAGHTLFRTLPKSLSDALRQFNHQEQTTLFVTLLSAFKVLLYSYTGQDDLVVGTAVAQRDRTELEPLIGFFANTVALRTHMSGDLTFTELLQRVQQVTGEALAHQELPFEQVVQSLAVTRRPNDPSWLQVMFVLHNASEGGLRLPGLEVSRLPVDPGTAKFDLTLIAVDQPTGLDFWIEYRSDLFHQSTIERLYHQFQLLLQAILDQPTIAVQKLLLLVQDETGKDGSLRLPNVRNDSPAIELNRSDEFDTLVEPVTDLEDQVTCLWRRLLGIESIAVDDDFFQLGGHSLLVVKLAAELEASLGVRLSVNELFMLPTVKGQVKLISARSRIGSHSSLITLRESSGHALIMLPGIEGVGRLAQSVLGYLPKDLHIVGVDLKHTQSERVRNTIEEIAVECVDLILESRLAQPYQLVGYSFGGMLAYEVACQLRAKGVQVGLVGIIDTGPVYTAQVSLVERTANLRYALANAPTRMLSFIRSQGRQQKQDRVVKFLRKVARRIKAMFHFNLHEHAVPDFLPTSGIENSSSEAQTSESTYLRAFYTYSPGEYPGAITLFRARERPVLRGVTPDLCWRHFPVKEIKLRHVPGDHKSMLNDPHCQVLAREIYIALTESLAANAHREPILA